MTNNSIFCKPTCFSVVDSVSVFYELAYCRLYLPGWHYVLWLVGWQLLRTST